MTTATVTSASTDSALEDAIASACSIIAPTWPLDRFIAVNPWWGWTGSHFEDVARELSFLSGAQLRMPREYFRTAVERGSITAEALERAQVESGNSETLSNLRRSLNQAEPESAQFPLLSDLCDLRRNLAEQPSWRNTITHQISQFCAAFFDAHQADWHPGAEEGLYVRWRRAIRTDHGIGYLMDSPEVISRARELTSDPVELIRAAACRFELSSKGMLDLFRAALLRINGWAAWCSYLRWQARLDGRDDSTIVDLLAIRLAWELLLDDGDRSARSPWSQWQHLLRRAESPNTSMPCEAIAHRAFEISYQTPLASALTKPTAAQMTEPKFQAAFCIDVRSEVFRRALENVSSEMQTLGFAGFFGLPIRFTPIGTSASRPQLPGLLAPALEVRESSGSPSIDESISLERTAKLRERRNSGSFSRLPASGFTKVEALGLAYLGKLVKRSFLPSVPSVPERAGISPDAQARLRPVLDITGEGAAAQRAALAERILRAMSFTKNFARIVALIGHGSQTANNPHAAGLDCGACCGQTGEYNARTLAGLLNDTQVRAALQDKGITIPSHTIFVAGLHNTTTDEVDFFDRDLVPASHAEDFDALNRICRSAGEAARAERAPALGLATIRDNPEALYRAVRERSLDWAQTRPEWGLANNAAFIVAPRERSKHINLAGRSFLHEYRWEDDKNYDVLELIMTAPMVVTHWINMQYYASTVDNVRYGCGNKVLHNVVGGNIGVFEGNGGDLRIGLSRQSLHDGEKWMHTPLRLSVFIEAPRGGIEGVIAKHATVRDLLHNEWLYLFRIDSQTNEVERYAHGAWETEATPLGSC